MKKMLLFLTCLTLFVFSSCSPLDPSRPVTYKIEYTRIPPYNTDWPNGVVLRGIPDPYENNTDDYIPMNQIGENDFFLNLVLYDEVQYEIFVDDARKYVGMEQDPGQVSATVGRELRINGYLLEMTPLAPQWDWTGTCRFMLRKGEIIQ